MPRSSTLPMLVVAADWSANENKRWMARALLSDHRYKVLQPEPVYRGENLLSRLRKEAGDMASILVGFDFPIGLPTTYAKKAGLDSFREALGLFGKGKWKEFYKRSSSPNIYRPFYPPGGKMQKGQYSHDELLKGLGFDTIKSLKRRCEVQSNAQCLFWTLGPNQVGPAAIHGWRDVIGPAKDDIHIWPFDGELPELTSRPGSTTVAEIYPGEAYSHLGFSMGSRSGRKKTNRDDRKSVAEYMLGVSKDVPVFFSDGATDCFKDGFRDDDDFDAMVGLLSMLLVVTGKRTNSIPKEQAVRNIEGWILGQSPDHFDSLFPT